MKAWQVKKLGTPQEALSIEDIEKPVVADGQLLIKVKAAAVNNNDLNKLNGSAQFAMPELPFTLGMEASGEVMEAAPGLESWIGKKVCAATQMSLGAYAEYAIASVDMSFTTPENLDDAQAAAFVVPYHTAYLLMITRAQLKKGETILIHGGSGGVGTAAIQIAKAQGAKVIATAGSEKKADYCKTQGADETILHCDEGFSAKVMQITEDKGVDVVFDLIGGKVRDQSFLCMTLAGRYVAAGFVGDGQNTLEESDEEKNTAQGKDTALLRKICALNLTVIGGLMAWRSNPEPFLRQFGLNPFDASVGQDIQNALCKWLDQGLIKPDTPKTRPFAELPDALTQMQQRKSVGRTVIMM